MRAGTPIESMAAAIHSALIRDLDPIKYTWQSPQERRDGKPGIEKERRPFMDDIKVYQFPQGWGSTALGFGGMGGSAMTDADTTVVMTHARHEAVVYFAGRLAYKVRKPSKEFSDDLARNWMTDCKDAVSKYGAEVPEPSYW